MSSYLLFLARGRESFLRSDRRASKMSSTSRGSSVADSDGKVDRYTNTFPGLLVQHARRKPQRRLLCCCLSILACFCLLQKVTVSAQEERVIGVDICGCQPAFYEFTLDFDQSCDDSDVVPNAQRGINETACLTEISGREQVPAAELVPISVQTVQIFELGQNKEVCSKRLL
jgi:hypothetical protein